MDVFYKLLLLSILSSSAFAQAQKDPDEDSPYEFGFTIDGQQHRHEKKDDRGIIQGEFGFITADGIYHVTVYATDENGSFKILSMRNLRISAPLDGSPFKGEISPEANKYRKQANLPPIPPPQPSPNPLALPEEEVPQQRITPTPKPSEFVKFTTQPTVKPGCASCGYITTRKPEPGQSAFPIQRTGLGAQNQNVVGNTFGNIPEKSITSADSRDTSNSQETPNNVPNTQLAAKEIIQSSGVPQKSPLPYQIAAGPQNTKYNTFGDDTNVPQVQPYQNTAGQSVPYTSGSPTGTADVGGLARSDVEGGSNLNDNANPLSIGIPDSNHVGSLHGNYNQPNSKVPVSNTETGSNNNVPFSQVEVGGVNQISTEGEAGPITSNAPSGNELPLPVSVSPQISSKSITQQSENPEPNPLQIPGQTPNAVSTLPPISVSDGAIHVGGDRKQVIPIKDKFPGMEDGLPAGIDEKDITDLLYKFHYTVGFHGHYEKGLKNGAKIGGYFVNGRDGISRVVTYIADENGYRPKVRFVNLGLESEDTPKPETEKTFGLKEFEFVWYPI